MRINNWCRKIASTLVAAGMLLPAAASAAPTGTNLVANPGFENVDPGITCFYGAVRLNVWDDGSQFGFAYNINQNYDRGGPLAGGGTYYFTPNAEGAPGGLDVTMPGQVSQNIDLSTGPTAAAIATGNAKYSLSAFFTSYANDGDLGNVQVDFLDLSLAPIVGQSVVLQDNDPTRWKQLSVMGTVPATTFAVRVSLFGTPVTFGPDGYIDNVSFSIIPEPSTAALGVLGFAAAGLARRRREQS
jgi:MYXO-CTERM domain-containing protein